MARQGIAHRLYTGKISYDFIGHRKRWYTISAVLLIVSLLALGIRGLNLGIEFVGGAQFQVQTSTSQANIAKIRESVVDTGLPELDGVVAQSVGEDGVRIQTRSLNAEEVSTVRSAIAEASGKDSQEVTYNLIGASWGEQITQRAIIALVVFLTLVMLLIWVYFRDWKMSVAAIVALFHDLFLTIGIYALVGFTVTPATLIGVLTILGYSLYDTVVVFDKVRENVSQMKSSGLTYTQAANNAVNQVLVRSLNTTIIGVLPVAALLFTGAFILGTGPLEDLGLALFVGMIAGAYSSIFIATPFLAQLREREPGMVEYRKNLEHRRQRSASKRRSSGGEDKQASINASVATATSTTTAVVDKDGADSQESSDTDSSVTSTSSDPDDVPIRERRQPHRTTRSQRKK